MVTYIPRKPHHVVDRTVLMVLGFSERERVGKIHNDGTGKGGNPTGRRARREGTKSKRTRGGRR